MEWSSSESKPSLGQKKGKLIYHSTLLRVFMITRKFNFFFAAVVALLFLGGGRESTFFRALTYTIYKSIHKGKQAHTGTLKMKSVTSKGRQQLSLM